MLVSRVALPQRRRDLKMEENPLSEGEGESWGAAADFRRRLCGNIVFTIVVLSNKECRRGERIYDLCQFCIIL